MKHRKLSLRSESLTELGSQDLGRVVGASAGTCLSCLKCITDAIAIGDVPDVTGHCFTHHSAADCITDELCK